MRSKDLKECNIPPSLAQVAGIAIRDARSAGSIKKSEIKVILTELSNNPDRYLEDEHFWQLAAKLIQIRAEEPVYTPRDEPASYKQWGTDIEDGAIEQMQNACNLPISIRGALMPDAHQGYGLPIGGVLATDNAIIPYAVGVDIACRMKLSIYDMSPIILDQDCGRFEKILKEETRFGLGCFFDKKREHSVMDEDWTINHIVNGLKDKAWSQLGTSGGGNHFVEFGILTLTEFNELGLIHGTYLALLSHSGSRGVGSTVANYYSKLAIKRHPELPKELKHLSYLSLDTYEGQQYWDAMQLMGKYAEGNHACIHKYVAKALGAEVILDIENHHNFAWKEKHDGKEVIVHRKGATPAGLGTLGIIPGSMATETYVVRGLGNSDSLNSSSHGAGRRMSRTQAKKQFTWSEAKKFIAERGVKLMSAGLDEVPMAYKDINEVMAAQSDLVASIATFQPKLVRMAEGK